MSQVHVGRQPIFDRAMGVVGYELLFRGGSSSHDASEHGDVATTRVIINTFTEFGLDRLVGSRKAFVNVTRPFVVGAMPVPFSPDVAVLELLDTVTADPDVLTGARELRESGFALALDGFALEPGREAFLPLCDYVKLDLVGVDPQLLAERVARCREQDVRLVAQRVETREEMKLALELGFDLFQGYFLVRPDVVSASSISPSQITALQLLAKLADPDIGVAEIEAVVRVDLALNYRVLRAANSVTTGVRRRIHSIRDALVLLGLRKLRSWLLLMILSDAGSGNEEQLSIAMTRARTCELVSADMTGVGPDTAFIAGLLSSLDLVLGLSMDVLVQRMPLSDELVAALVRREGPLGSLVTAVVAYEDGDVAGVEDTGFALFDVSRAYLNAVGWSMRTIAPALAA